MRKGWHRPVWGGANCTTGPALIELPGHVHQAGEGARLHLAHELATMHFHCDFRDTQLHGHLLVQAAGDDQLHDFAFTQAQ